jgi:hypothetical protein
LYKTKDGSIFTGFEELSKQISRLEKVLFVTDFPTKSLLSEDHCTALGGEFWRNVLRFLQFEKLFISDKFKFLFQMLRSETWPVNIKIKDAIRKDSRFCGKAEGSWLRVCLIQSNLATAFNLGAAKKWPLYTGGHFAEVFQWKLLFNLTSQGYGWPL